MDLASEIAIQATRASFDYKIPMADSIILTTDLIYEETLWTKDDDGTPDIDQSDIKCVNTVVGDGRVGIKGSTNVASVESINSIDPDTISDTTNRPDEMPLGLISFKLKVDNAGDIAMITVYLSETAPDGAKWYKYDPINGWQDYSGHATFSADRKSVFLGLKDGGFGDADGTENRVIVDPSGLGTASSNTASSNGGGASSVSGGGGGGGCFMATAAFGSPSEGSVNILRQFRDTYLLPTKAGQTFVNAYYRYSPPVADFIARYDTARLMVRWSLLPLVGVSWIALKLGPGCTLALTALLLGLMCTTAVVTLRRRRLRCQT